MIRRATDSLPPRRLTLADAEAFRESLRATTAGDQLLQPGEYSMSMTAEAALLREAEARLAGYERSIAREQARLAEQIEERDLLAAGLVRARQHGIADPAVLLAILTRNSLMTMTPVTPAARLAELRQALGLPDDPDALLPERDGQR